MKVRTVYFKVEDPARAAAFWSALIGVAPHKTLDVWHEINCGDVRLGFLLNDLDEDYHGSACVPVFQLDETQMADYVSRAKELGATIIVDALHDPLMKSVVLRDPAGHEFEFTCRHD